MALVLQLPNQTSRVYDRPVMMGILNVTPDSFSDGSQYADVESAVDAAQRMIVDGADIIDVGGESTRPGAERVSGSEQIRRVVPVIEALCQRDPTAVVSVDTTVAEVAKAAVRAGAAILNDVSAGRDDPGMFSLAADCGAPLVLMHMQGNPQTMQQDPQYDDVVSDVKAFLIEQSRAAMAAGVLQEKILIDPGIGFGKTSEHNFTLLAHLDQMVATGFPVLLGTSRKRFLSAATMSPGQPDLSPSQRVAGTCATTALGVIQGVSVFRVHDVRENRQAADTAWSVCHQGQ